MTGIKYHNNFSPEQKEKFPQVKFTLERPAHSALLTLSPYYETAENSLKTDFAVSNPVEFIKNACVFQQETNRQLNLPPNLSSLSPKQTHQFYSLIYHILQEQPEKGAEWNRNLLESKREIEDSFGALGLGKPLSKEVLQKQMGIIEAFVKTKSQINAHRFP